MAAKEGDGKPKQAPKQSPARTTAESSFDLKPKPSAPAPKSAPAKKPVPLGASDFEASGAKGVSLADMRRISGTAAHKPAAPKSPAPAAVPVAAGSKKPTVYQRQMQSSGFDNEERTQIDAVLGNVGRLELDADEEEETTVSAPVFDGIHAPRELTSRDGWKAVNPPVQSKPGRRSSVTYGRVIDQFAAGHNPRYVPDDKGSRVHLFIWDVSRAMNCEVPHFQGGREFGLAQTVDWMRMEAHHRGWRKANAQQAAEAADRGELALALPRDGKVKLLAVIRPGGLGPDGFPRAAATVPQKGNDLPVLEALKTRLIDYFTHD
jgi:hypothetical protein